MVPEVTAEITIYELKLKMVTVSNKITSSVIISILNYSKSVRKAKYTKCTGIATHIIIIS